MKLFRITIETKTKTLKVKDIYAVAENERAAENKVRQLVADQSQKKLSNLEATSIAEVATEGKKLVL